MPYLLIAILVIVLLVVVWIISVSNKLNRAIVKIEEADSGIDVALTKRYDVLTKMMDVVKAYAKHEKETLFEVINLRAGMTTEEKIDANNKMSSNFEKINVLAEAYPELKSSENYRTLQQSIVEVEEHLQAARRMYNSNVSIFNQMLVTFPTSAIASSKNLTKRSFFEADEAKKSDVKIDL
jgi:LemA protein